MFVLNFYSPVFVDQLRRHRKTATIRVGDKSAKYRKGNVVMVTVGFQHSPRDIEHDNPEFRRLDETIHFLEQIYGRSVSEDDAVTVVRFSEIKETPSEFSERLRGSAPHQN